MGLKFALKVLVVVLLVCCSSGAGAKIPERFRQDFEARYTPALPHEGLITAAEPLLTERLRSFVVVKRGGVIPVERAYYFVTPGEYDYRGAVVKGQEIKTRLGKAYTYLPRGAIMALSGVVYSGRYVYLKLLSPDAIKSDVRPKLKPTRVSVMLGFKFSRPEIEGDDMSAVFQKIEEWLEPFQSLDEAVKYSKTLLPLDKGGREGR